MERNNMGRCRSCGQLVVWIRTRGGKNMPCDPQMLTYRQSATGKERIVTTAGDVVSAEVVESGAADSTGIGYISHFATCPNAARHRKRR